ncbi:hypothetical protein CMK11_22055 [Candidatus Poribacteria bacterium]|nr:hypothetical protein [Candidatus Poribacteria bacterium]
MKIVPFTASAMDSYAEFWWSIYADLPYVVRADAYQASMLPAPGPTPGYFISNLQGGLGGDHQKHWAGEVTDDTVVVAEADGAVAGILIASVDSEKRAGNILSAFVRRDGRGRQAATATLQEILERFGRMGLSRAVATPDWTRGIEVENPVHLALLDAGFAWERDWSPAYPLVEYSVCLGGVLGEFRVQPEIHASIERLRKEETIEIEKVDHERFARLRRLDTGQPPEPFVGHETFVALYEGLVAGWLPECDVGKDEFGRMFGESVPEVIHGFRNRGIGKALYHLGMEEVVRQGGEYGFTGTTAHNPARLIYRSIGFRYWYTSFCLLSKRLPGRES